MSANETVQRVCGNTVSCTAKIDGAYTTLKALCKVLHFADSTAWVNGLGIWAMLWGCSCELRYKALTRGTLFRLHMERPVERRAFDARHEKTALTTTSPTTGFTGSTGSRTRKSAGRRRTPWETDSYVILPAAAYVAKCNHVWWCPDLTNSTDCRIESIFNSVSEAQTEKRTHAIWVSIETMDSLVVSRTFKNTRS